MLLVFNLVFIASITVKKLAVTLLNYKPPFCFQSVLFMTANLVAVYASQDAFPEVCPARY